MISFSRIVNLLLTLAIAFLLYRLILAKAAGHQNAEERDRLFAKLGMDGGPEPTKIKIKRIGTMHSNVDAWRVFGPENVTFWVQVQTPDSSSISPVSGIGSSNSAQFSQNPEVNHGTIFAHSYEAKGRSGSRLGSYRGGHGSKRFASRISTAHARFLSNHWSELERVDVLGDEKTLPADECVPLLKFVVPENLRTEFLTQFGKDSNVIWDEDCVVLKVNCGTMAALRSQHHGSRRNTVNESAKLAAP